MQPGSKIGGYEILSPIGKGGMGEVFRARDLQLKRDVALKVLPASVANDPERMGRFQREAELLASLNHPNIASIYGIAQEGSTRALVMELVEGASPKGPLAWNEAWKIAEPIASALEYAHERGIIHRDLKPANVLVTPDGVVKLLDFGLAKALTGPMATNGDPADSPTLTIGATAVGTILGTAAYMAPEQTKGKTVDKRADIWALGVALWAPWRELPPVSEVRFQIPRPRATSAAFLSPDGQRVALTADGISVRELNSLETRELPLTRLVFAFLIWSPDSRWIAYHSADFKLKKVALDGSPPVTVADMPTYGGGSWNEDGVILVGVRSGGLQRVQASGGTLTPVTTLAKGHTEHLFPQFVGGGRFLYQVNGERGVSGIYLASLRDPNGKLVLSIENAGNVKTYSYVPALAGGGDSYILYTSQDVLLAQAVDPSSFELRGSAITIAQNAGAISASQTGALTYLPASAAASAVEWLWLDRTGRQIPSTPVAQGGSDATISPNGKRWAIAQGGDIWLYDTARGAPSRFTFESTNERFFAWSPDDQWIAYAAGVGGAHDRILRKNTLTSGEPELLVSGGLDFQVADWSRNGKFLLFSDRAPSTGSDLWMLDLQAKGAKPVPYLQTPAMERLGAFSPDGHWIAYQSDESGRAEIYVQSFPLGGGKFQVSTAGGIHPRWRADGRELYYMDGRNLVAVKIQTSPQMEIGASQPLFEAVTDANRLYDVSADGNRFLVRTAATGERDVLPVTVVVNWQAGLKKPQ